MVGPTTPTHWSREKEEPNEVIKLHGAGVVHLSDLPELCVGARQTKIAHEPVRAPPSRPIFDLGVAAQPSRSCTAVEKFHSPSTELSSGNDGCRSSRPPVHTCGPYREASCSVTLPNPICILRSPARCNFEASCRRPSINLCNL